LLDPSISLLGTGAIHDPDDGRTSAACSALYKPGRTWLSSAKHDTLQDSIRNVYMT